MHRHRFYLYPLLGLLAFVLSCNSSKQASEKTALNLKLEELATAKLGNPHSFEQNATGEYTIVSRALKTRPNDAYPTIRFFIYDLANEEIIHENTVPGGELSWESDFDVRVHSAVIIPDPSENDTRPKEYFYNVKTRKKYSGKFMKNKN